MKQQEVGKQSPHGTGAGGKPLVQPSQARCGFGDGPPQPIKCTEMQAAGLDLLASSQDGSRGAGGQQVACLSSHTTRASGKEVDSMYRCFFSSLQLHQFNCSSKVTASALPHPSPHDPPNLGLLLPERGKQPLALPLPPCGLKPEAWGWSVWRNQKDQRLFLAGAEVRIWARVVGGWVRDEGYFLRVCCLRACSRCRAPGVLDPAPMEKEGAVDPKGPTPTKPWAGVEDAPKERLLPAAPTPGAGVF